MRIPAVLIFVLLFHFAKAQNDSTSLQKNNVLIIPYNPMMHLSDADQDISEGSEKEIPEVRATLRRELIRALNKQFADLYNVNVIQNDFVGDEKSEEDLVYHTQYYEQDSVYPLRFPSRFQKKDTASSLLALKGKKYTGDTFYINSGLRDRKVFGSLENKYSNNYFIFINELDIKTHFDDCVNLAMKIYKRDLKVHYTIMDKEGKQIYGDVAVVHFQSNSNSVDEIAKENFPIMARQIYGAFQSAVRR